MRNLTEKEKEIIELNRKFYYGEEGGQRAYLSGADLRGAYLRGAYLSGADLRGAYLRGAYLSGADLSGAYLNGAYLNGADLRGAYLSGADLRGAYLSGAYLSGAYLNGADLRGADLRGAYLSGAYLRGADLSGAKYLIAIGPIGSREDILYAVLHLAGDMHAIRNDDGTISQEKIKKTDIYIKTGCFWGTIAEFKAAVKKEHANDEHGKDYKAACAMIETYFRSDKR